MFQNDKWIILLNFYNTREDLAILKMFVPRNRDSKPRKHRTGCALLHEKNIKNETKHMKQWFSSIKHQATEDGVPGGQGMSGMPPSGGDQASSPGR